MATMAATAPKQFTRKTIKMGTRTQEIRPVGAWVQPEISGQNNSMNAVLSAEYEEEKGQQRQREKMERLARFQEDVRKRVQALDRAKKQQALEKSYRAVELEHNVVRQSALAAEKSSPRKNNCVVRDDVNLSIRHSATHNTQGAIVGNANDHSKQQFQQQTHQVHKFTSQARRKLTSRKVVTEHYLHQDLPGGEWKEGFTLDNPASRHTEDKSYVEEIDPEDDDKENIGETEARIVHFDHSPVETRESRIARKSAVELVGTQVERCPMVPNIYPGVQTEEERIRTQNQRAMYRRLFMDIEREQVKENQRRRDHRRKISEIKKVAETERRLIEQESELAIEPRHPVTGETPAETINRKVAEDSMKGRLEEERQKDLQRSRESERFLDALKRNLRERIQKQNIDLPPLCYCGATVWDTNPDTCANNCVFYKNPKAYARALQSLLASCDVI